MEDNIQEWKVSDAEFKGFVKANLEGLKEEVQLMRSEKNKQDDKISDIDKRLVKTEVKSTLWGTLAAIIVSVGSWFLR